MLLPVLLTLRICFSMKGKMQLRILIPILSLFFLSHSVALATYVPPVNSPSSNREYSTIDELQPIIIRIFGLLFYSAAAVFIFMVGYGIWKSSLATGDPRGFAGAKQTWSYALFGFVIVAGFIVIMTIIASLVGKGNAFSGGIEGIVDEMFKGLDELLQAP